MREAQGINLCDFNTLIATHAAAVHATLVNRDKALGQAPKNRLWAEIQPPPETPHVKAVPSLAIQQLQHRAY